MTLSQIPEVRRVALAGRFALIGGWPAWALGRILRDYRGGLESLLDRSNVPAELREDAIRGAAALVAAGRAWRLELAEGGSGSGTVSARIAVRLYGRRVVVVAVSRLAAWVPRRRESFSASRAAESASWRSAVGFAAVGTRPAAGGSSRTTSRPSSPDERRWPRDLDSVEWSRATVEAHLAADIAELMLEGARAALARLERRDGNLHDVATHVTARRAVADAEERVAAARERYHGLAIREAEATIAAVLEVAS